MRRRLLVTLVTLAVTVVTADAQQDIVRNYPGLVRSWRGFIFSTGDEIAIAKCRGLVEAGVMDSVQTRGEWYYRMVLPQRQVWFRAPSFEERAVRHNDLFLLGGTDRAVFEDGIAIDPDSLYYTTILIGRDDVTITETPGLGVKVSKGAPNQPPNITDRGAFISRQKRQDGRVTRRSVR